jgi:hypothetical protein
MEVSTKVKYLAGEVLYRSPLCRKLYVQARYPSEIKFSQEKKISHESNFQSILFFTTHKCASMYVGKTLKKVLSNQKNLKFIDLNAYRVAKGATISESGGTIVGAAEDIDDFEYKKRIYFEPFGYFFGPLRHPGYLSLANDINNYKVLLMLRDPRNMLTSLYYSIRDTHILPFASSDRRSRMLLERKKISSQSIDEFVLEYRIYWLERYKAYCQNFIGLDNVLFVKFEDMICNFNDWLESIINFVDLEVSQVEKQKIIASAAKNHNPISDYRQKLKPETIKQLNQDFFEVLSILQYE